MTEVNIVNHIEFEIEGKELALFVFKKIPKADIRTVFNAFRDVLNVEYPELRGIIIVGTNGKNDRLENSLVYVDPAIYPKNDEIISFIMKNCNKFITSNKSKNLNHTVEYSLGEKVKFLSDRITNMDTLEVTVITF